MPIWDFICSNCKEIKWDQFIPQHSPMPTCCGLEMTRMAAAPSFVMHGFSEANGYAGKRTVTRYINGIKTITDVVD